jgi:outer membrane protein insertion porin family
MTLRSIVHATLAFAASSAALAQTTPAPEPFTVHDIRVEGLQRISEGTVYNYLPVNVGDRLDRRRVEEALKALYATGFFKDVEVRREGGTLVVAVLERPSIESFELKGNKDIKTEDLQKSLRNVGLATGKTYDKSVLDEVKQYLTDQYFARGKYAVRVDAKVEEVPANKVKITIDITEGKRAKIRQINIVGNSAFKDKELLAPLELKTPHFTSFYKQDDRYSRESLSGDLEKLRSYYLDRGYANFHIDSTQVAIAPEKDDMFVTINVTEGDVYKVSEVKLAGNMVVPEEELKKLIVVRPGDVYSRKLITTTTELISQRLGQDGYAFAKIDPVPQTNEETHEISLTLLVEPGNRVYVRRVNFNGTTGVNDEVFRREMRQLEGGYLSNTAVDRSKQRIQRLPFIEKVETETNPVAGTPDLVDVDFQIKEGLPGQFGGSIGYSEAYGAIIGGNFVHSNFMGSGDRVALDISTSKYQKTYSFSHTDPYTTINNVARTLSFTYRDVTQFVSAASDFSTKTFAAGVDYGYPISEFQTLRAGLSLQRADLLTTTYGSATQAVDWVRNNGKTYSQSPGYCLDIDPSKPTCIFGSRFDTYELTAGWQYDSRNRTLFADHGARNRLNLTYTLPGSDAEFMTASYDYLQFIPLWRSFTLMINSGVSYGHAMGNTTSIPPYRQWFAGGPDTVRGYRESRLGPKDSFGNPYGGNLLVTSQFELLLPIPEKWRNSARFSLFYDIGNVFSTENVKFFGPPPADGSSLEGAPVNYKFSYSELKHSAGVAVQWLAPLGVFRFSYAIPLNANKTVDGVSYSDETEGFQFSIGQAF